MRLLIVGSWITKLSQIFVLLSIIASVHSSSSFEVPSSSGDIPIAAGATSCPQPAQPQLSEGDDDYSNYQWHILAPYLEKIDFQYIRAREERQRGLLVERVSIETLEKHVAEFRKFGYLYSYNSSYNGVIDQPGVLRLTIGMMYKTKSGALRSDDSIRRIVEFLLSSIEVSKIGILLKDGRYVIDNTEEDNHDLISEMKPDERQLAIQEGQRIAEIMRQVVEENRNNPRKTPKWKELYPLMMKMTTIKESKILDLLLDEDTPPKNARPKFWYEKYEISALVQSICIRWFSHMPGNSNKKTREEIAQSVKFALEDKKFAGCAGKLAQYMRQMPERLVYGYGYYSTILFNHSPLNEEEKAELRDLCQNFLPNLLEQKQVDL